MSEWLTSILATFAGLFPIVNPFSTAALFLAITANLTGAERKRQVLLACCFATGVLLVCLFGGSLLLAIAVGFLLVCIGVQFVGIAVIEVATDPRILGAIADALHQRTLGE